MGFEPTVPFSITGFQDQLLKPLGHLSICFSFCCALTSDSLILSLLFASVNNFFQFFYFFWFAFLTDEKWGRQLYIKCFVSLRPNYSTVVWTCSKAHYIYSCLPRFSVCCKSYKSIHKYIKKNWKWICRIKGCKTEVVSRNDVEYREYIQKKSPCNEKCNFAVLERVWKMLYARCASQFAGDFAWMRAT